MPKQASSMTQTVLKATFFETPLLMDRSDAQSGGYRLNERIKRGSEKQGDNKSHLNKTKNTLNTLGIMRQKWIKMPR